MTDNIQEITADIPYTIIYSGRRKTSEIRVGPRGIEIRVPTHKTDSEILDIINANKYWICEKYLGFKVNNRRFRSKVSKSYIKKRITELASKIGVTPSRILIKPLKTMWGSATPNGTITINSRLSKAPKGVIDYIIIHELCHLKISGHSSTYWNLVGIHMPNYEKKIEWLNKYGKFICL